MSTSSWNSILSIANCFSRCPRWSVCIVLLTTLLVAQLSACATLQQPPVGKADTGSSISAKPAYTVMEVAESLRGKPYQYGGITPNGFDCSGFVHYVYRKAGISIPRTTRDQYQVSRRLSIDVARPGDLLFFRISSRKPSHVGLYAGNGRFIHASTSQNRVAEAFLQDPYWHDRLIAVGRVYHGMQE